jgi:hypothetical protein
MSVDIVKVRDVLAKIKPLAAEYYRLTGKPLGVTGEIAEFVAAEQLGLELTAARSAGYDATRNTPNGPVRIQIKGRVCDDKANLGQRIGRIKPDAQCDLVLLVLLDKTMNPREIWEAPALAVLARLAEPGSKARNERGALSIRDFKKLPGSKRIWSTDGALQPVP